MKKHIILLAGIFLLTLGVQAQQTETKSFPVKMGELTAPQFAEAVEKSNGTCIIPMGVLEKHGPQLPLASDVIQARETAKRAASKEYALVFPYYYFGQIFEAKHQPGTLAYSNELIWKMLEETCQELARNGVKKIILLNGHGGNSSFLPYFCQSQLAKQKDYAVVLFQPETDEETQKKVNQMRKTEMDRHAGETETSAIHAIRPDLVHPEAADDESGEDQGRLTDMPYGYTGIWWYGRFPNHYAGDGSQPNKKMGELLINSNVNQLVELIRYMKKNDSVLELQKEFFKRAKEPIEEYRK
ncbi:MAG: creatininase family protein [Bacteroidales bacterium]|nr:creatininase family protein [Bacteroidales bacterium]